MTGRIRFNDLRPLHERLAGELEDAFRRVLASGSYVLGEEVAAFEEDLSVFLGGVHAVGVASGTDAIELALRALGVGAGDEVITVSLTAVATVCAIERAGAVPVLVDVDGESFTLDPAAAAAAITPRTRAIVAVHLYGHPADMDALGELGRRHGLAVIEDCAQALGARWRGRRVGTLGAIAALSFYPTKNLGAYGDGGAVVTADPAVAARVRSLRNYGQLARNHHVERGLNSRLDELQAALLRVKLGHLEAQNVARRHLAETYAARLSGVVKPTVDPRAEHAFHLYVVRSPARDRLREELDAVGVETMVHYPVAVHRQPAYAHLRAAAGTLPVTERLVSEVLSLPFYLGLSTQEVSTVAAAIEGAGSTRIQRA